MANLYIGSVEDGIHTVLTSWQFNRIRSGTPDCPGGTATFVDRARFENSWLRRVVTGTLDDMHQWLEGHEVRDSEHANVVPYTGGVFHAWGDQWRLTPREVITMFELGRLPADCLR